MMMLLLGIAAGTVLILCYIAFYLWFKVYQQKQKELEIAKTLDQNLTKKREKLSQDIRFIAQAMLSNQCEMTEGCMRLKVLLDLIDQRYTHHPKLQQLQAFYNLVSHFPTHQAYKALTKAERLRFDAERFALEAQHKESVFHDIESLNSFTLDWIDEIQWH
jgi:hypothetical protein